MRVTIEDVEKIAALAKLHLSEEEKEKYCAQLDQILTYVQKLNELDTEDIEPTYYVQYSGDVMREDKVAPSLSRDKALQNAPLKVQGFVRVPKVISQE
jgi:aspartyl-tRNA(Asn)/glutamyl-tRNA(Gln) amidotransferase subunit C